MISCGGFILHPVSLRLILSVAVLAVLLVVPTSGPVCAVLCASAN